MTAILKTRAEKLAKPFAAKEDENSKMQLLSFSLDQEVWAIELKWIEEVYQIKEPASLPRAPSFLYGIVNVRRKIIPIFNLKEFFGFPKHTPDQKNRAIILSEGQTKFGILTDAIVGIETTNKNEIQPLPPSFSGIREEFLLGITMQGMAIADGRKLLSNPRLQIKG